jgi:hypothetical protein
MKNEDCNLPLLYWIPKTTPVSMHTTLYHRSCQVFYQASF